MEGRNGSDAAAGDGRARIGLGPGTGLGATVAAVLVLVLLPPPLPAQGADELRGRVEPAVESVADTIIALRHTIHRNPELGNREEETAALVADRLRGLGFDRVETGVAHTGVVGVLEGGQPGPVVAVRADMDALPVEEKTGFPFASTKTATWEGETVPVMHACGHDIHTSVGMGVATVLAGMREDLPGTVKFIFQPAEEGPPRGEKGGAKLMVAEGVLENPRPEAIFGLHAYPEMEVGELGYTVGPALAAVDHFYVTIQGEQAHGASPHQSVDPVVMASQAVTALQTIRSRNLNPREPSVVTVGMIHGGDRFNIIPDQVQLEGTVRTYDEEVRDAVERRMGEILEGITAAGGGSYELTYDRMMPATVNDPQLSRRVAPGLERTVGEEDVSRVPPTMGGEDFAFFSRRVPGFYFRLGTTEPGGESGGLHTPTFRGADASVPVGIRAMTNVVLEYLGTAGASASGE